MEIKGKVVLITGGATRLGAVISKHLALKGARLAIHYHKNKTLKEGDFFQADLSNVSEIETLVASVEKKLGPIDVLINNAAVFKKIHFSEIDEAAFDHHMSINLKAPFFLSQRVAGPMLKKKSGKIINIVDVSAMKPYRNYTHYSITKGGLLTLTQALARELAPHIQVNAIALGPILPPEDYSKETIQAIAEKTLLKRWGDPREVAKWIGFLIEEMDFATGSVWTLDGGRFFA